MAVGWLRRETTRAEGSATIVACAPERMASRVPFRLATMPETLRGILSIAEI